MINQEILSIKQRFGIVGNSPLLNRAIQVASQVAPTNLSVLVLGESGTGKESFSKIIHSLSKRKHADFIAVNCGAIPEGTVYSELFGHEKGAFTGSSGARKGFFETVNGGTIFLDEIGELPERVQAMLLRVLENGEFIRMGGSDTKVVKTDVRVIAATNVDLIRAVEEKKFREDLYFRLNTVPIYVPALRERGKDIELLFRKFAYDFAEEYRVEAVKLNDEAKNLLIKYRFPGNIRQLKNLVNQISVLEIDDKVITVDKLITYLPKEQRSNLPALLKNADSNDFSERELFYKVLLEMKNDMNELKKLVYQMIQSGEVNTDTLKYHKDLFDNVDNVDLSPTSPTSLVLSNPNYVSYEKDSEYKTDDAEVTQDTDYEEEKNTLSLEETEKDLIKKALKKHKNRRKYAAEELGISERTLYRKIKQYSIDKQ